MAMTYRPYVPEQDFLLPPSLREWLPEDHLVYFVSDLVDQLDLSAITTVYEEEDRGYPPYHPAMLTKMLVYAYCVGVFSSRKIQRRLIEDVPFRVLAAGNEPDFRTIADVARVGCNGFARRNAPSRCGPRKRPRPRGSCLSRRDLLIAGPPYQPFPQFFATNHQTLRRTRPAS
jgi:transposase